MKKVSMVSWLIVIAWAVLPISAMAGNEGKEEGTKVNWEPIMNAIIKVESDGNSRLVCGNQCGAMQITPGCVEDCNAILKARKSKKRYTLADRFSVQKSKEMFLIYQSRYNPGNDIERAIRTWNGGPGYKLRSTQRYYEKVMKYL